MNREPHEAPGQGIVDYALILVLIVVLVIITLVLVGPSLGEVFAASIDALASS